MRAAIFNGLPLGAILLSTVALVATFDPSLGDSASKPGGLADLCPVVDSRDTINTVRSRVAARLGEPVKEETVDTQYVLTFREKDGTQLFVMLTRDSSKLEVNCYEQKP